MTILKRYETELKAYCDQNLLSFDKILSSPKCGNDKVLVVQRVDKEKAANSKTDNVPAEILITITVKDNGEIECVKGKNANKYLSK